MTDSMVDIAATPARAPVASRLIRVALCFLAAGILLYTLVFHINAALLPGPLEYREPAMYLTTDLLVHGGDPYALKNMPMTVNVYGLGYHYLATPLVRWFGSPVLVHRAISGVCLLAACGMVVMALRAQATPLYLALTAAVLLYADLGLRVGVFGPMTIEARPDALALLFFLASVIVPWRHRFSGPGLVVSGMLVVAAFFTKPYLALGVAIIGAHVFLFESKRKAVLYVAGTTAGLAGLIFLAMLRYECFWTILFVANARSSESMRSVAHMLLQFKTYLIALPACLLLLVWAAVDGVRSYRGAAKGRGVGGCGFDRPVFSVGGDVFWTALLVGLLLFVAKLGPHKGNIMLYLYQLISPWLFILVFRFLGRMVERGHGWVSGLVLVDLVLLAFAAPPIPVSQQTRWEEWRALLAPHKQVYVPPPLAWIAHEQGKFVYDNGLSEYYGDGLKGNWWLDDAAVQARFNEYIHRINTDVAAEKFELLVIPYWYGQPTFHFLPMELVMSRYRPIGEFELPLPWPPKYQVLVLARKRDLPP